jgi:hypothetical protein
MNIKVDVRFDPGRENVDRDLVLAPLRHNDVCITLCRFNKLQVHRFHETVIMFKHLLK